MNQPKISILLPVYGAEHFIERCAVSLFEQTYDNLEYIFVNDCTKDRSIDVLQDVLERYPHRKPQVRIIHHEKNKGVGEARNTLLDAARGEFVLFVDPDDYIDIDLIAKLLAHQQEKDVDIVVHDHKIISKTITTEFEAKNYHSVHEYLLDLLRRKTPVAPWGKMMRLSLFNDNRIRVELGVNCSEDMMIIARAVFFAKSITACHGVYYYYDRTNENSITGVFKEKNVLDDYKVTLFLEHFFYGTEYEADFRQGANNRMSSYFSATAIANNITTFNLVKNYIKQYNVLIPEIEKPLLYMPCHIACIYVKVGLCMKSMKRMFKKIF